MVLKWNLKKIEQWTRFLIKYEYLIKRKICRLEERCILQKKWHEICLGTWRMALKSQFLKYYFAFKGTFFLI